MIRLLSWTDEEELRFYEFEGEDGLPAYAVLSHTWHMNNKEEVTYEDLETGSGQHKAGYSKIAFCKKQASVDDLTYIWIDTCCINRKSEPELSEAINSMFRWYKNATRCYVYLSDVYTSYEGRGLPLCGDEWEALFLQSRWFTRGWTLQELIAPQHVEFFGRDGTYLGNKSTLETAISNATGISLDVLRGRPLAECTIEERMIWAKARKTKREEDHVYSLFGIFDVTLPLIYGEGKAKAFRRLYEEISRYAPLHIAFAADAGREDAIQEIKVLQSAMQKLEARLTTSLITRSNSIGLQESSTMLAMHQSLSSHKERLGERINAACAGTESAGNDPLRLLRTLILKLTQLLSVFVAPLGYFETWSSFRPEEYTINDIGPQIICYSLSPAFPTVEMHSSFAIATQDLFVAKTQRHWIRIKLKTAVAIGTARWKVVAEHKLKQPSYIGWRQLPNNVISLVQRVMIDHPYVGDDTEINIRFDKESDATDGNSDPKATSLTRTLDTGIIDSTRNLTEVLRHQNVRMISDTALVTAYVQGICLVAHLDNRWVAYRTATVGRLGADLLCRDVQASVALRGASHVAQLVGIVVDSEKKLLKGILVELPSKGPMFRLMNTHRLKYEPIPWPIRQKWAKQIVRGVAAYHERGQVIAGMRTYSWCVCIDDCDNAVIVGFSNSHPAVHRHHGLLPPEYRTKAFKKGDGQVGPDFDIFQLGLLLWHLYRDQHQQGARTFCSLAGCNNAELATCGEHGDPIALPKATADVPDYLDSIISRCRQEDPRKRPAAWELVHMFPEDQEILREIDLLNADKNVIPGDHSTITADPRLTRLEVVRDVYGPTVICSLCSEHCCDIYYHCDSCDLGNYDLCHKCLVQGKHCWDEAHLLARFTFEAFANMKSGERVAYYSSVNEKGEREESII